MKLKNGSLRGIYGPIRRQKRSKQSPRNSGTRFARRDGLRAVNCARFVTAYNAALKLCTVVLYASGYRTSGAGAHFYTIEAMSEM